MTRRHAALASGIAASLAMLAGAALLYRLHDARSRTERSIAAAARVRSDVARLVALRSARPTIGTGVEPTSDALALVNHALAGAGVPTTCLRSLAPATEAAPSSLRAAPGYRRASMRLSLAGLTLPQLGAFLQTWRTSQGIWSVERIDLRTEQRAPSGAAQASDQWTATLGLTATYLDTGGRGDEGGEQ